MFGPVFSRRLGRSLGIDTVPFKTCTYDCVYCQLGKTPEKTLGIEEYSRPEEIIKELAEVLNSGGEADYITLSGSGEPTLNSGTGEIISAIKKISRVPVCVITNGSLLGMPRVRNSLLEADLVIPSLDAAEDGDFQRVNRPHEALDFRSVAAGIESFSKEFSGKLHLEVMLVSGMNDSEEKITKLRSFAERINPCKIQINTIARPAACPDARGVGGRTLNRAAAILGEKAEIIASPPGRGRGAAGGVEELLEAIKRRPFTAGDISSYLGLGAEETLKRISELLEDGVIFPEASGGRTYYKSGAR